MLGEQLSPLGQPDKKACFSPKETEIKRQVRFVLDRLDNIMKPMIPEYAPGFNTVFCKEIKDKNVTPVIITSHQGHGDLLAMAILSQQLYEKINITRYPDGNYPENKFKGFLLPIAGSLRTGHQGELLKELIIQLEEQGILDQYHLALADYTREKDQVKYGLDVNNGLFLRRLLKQIRDGNGIVLPPEASVESGRVDSSGNKKGMQRFNCVNIDTILRSMELNEKTALFIPAASNRSFNIISPDSLQLTFEALNAISGKGDGKSLMDIKVGIPIPQNEIISSLKEQGKPVNFENIGDFFGEKVAPLLPPPHERILR